MKQLFTLATSFVICASLQAQITIGQNEMPHSGDDLHRTRATLNPFVNYGATGAGHTWNFASLTAAGEESTQYVSVGSTNFVYALVYADIFLNPNRANHANSGTDIAFSDLLPIDNAFTFRHQSSSAYKTVGYGAEVANIPVPIIFDQQDVVYELPLNYGNSSVSQSSWKINLPTLAYYGYQQTRQNEVDGWGNITTPSGTFDALRVKTTITAKDTINIDTLSLGFNIDRPKTREYKWLAQGIRVPVLQINTVELLGAEVVTGIFFYDQPHTIIVEQPLAAMLCAGSSVSVPYERTGTYNSGSLFIPANVFRAQLSDANGDFANAVNIGSVTSTVSGTISATIPANTPLGTGYRIRVVSTSPAFTGVDNGFDITIGTTPVALASADGPTSFCAGETVELMAEAAPELSYQWMLDGVAIEDATTASMDVDASGSYSVEVTNACGSDVSAAIDVVVNPLPVHTPEATELIACSGDAVTLSTTNTSGQAVLAYQWMLNGEAVDGATSADLTTVDAGEYTLEVSNITTGCNFTTAVITVISETVTSPALTAAGPVTFCQGGSVQLGADAQGNGVLWLFNGDAIPDAEGESLTVDLSGTYSVVAIGASGCVSEPSNVILVDVLAVPDAPAITASSDISFCEGGMVTLVAGSDDGVSFLWNTGSTANELDVTTSGTYTVEAIANNGCSSAASEAVVVTVLELPEAPVITASSDISFCEGGMVTLVAGSDDEVSFLWNNGSTANELDVTTSGTYTVEAIANNGCSSVSSEAVEVTVHELPEVPTITELDGVLQASGTGSFQWSFNGSEIADADQAEFTPTASGVYSVTVTNDNGCSSTSEEYAFIHTAVAQHAAAVASVWPNPTTGAFTITLPGAKAGEQFSIFDATGKLVQAGSLSGIRTSVELASNTPGLYLLRLESHGASSVVRIVLN
ncbi:MAG: T9SS type A sorting domain-containing protein [Flavobacteriales bacterium]